MKEIQSDIVVIGSGIAGAVVAYKLALKGLDVLIIEAGPRIDTEDVRKKFATSPHMHHNAGYPDEVHAPIPTWTKRDTFLAMGSSKLLVPEYLRCVGGTTWHWDGVTHRFSQSDLSLKTTHGVGVDWPLTYEDLSPYYDEAEKELGVAGHSEGESATFPMKPTPASYLENWVHNKLKGSSHALSVCPMARNSKDYDGRSQCQGFSTCSLVCPSKAKYTGVVHVEKAEEKGAHLLANTRVDQIIVGKDQKISHLIARKPDGAPFKIKGNQFILAANALESPRLLLNSATEQHPHGVANSSGYVGRNLMLHPSIIANYVVKEDVFPGRGPNIHFVLDKYRETPSRTSYSGFLIHLLNTFNVYADYHTHFLDKIYPPALDLEIAERYRKKIEFNSCMEMLPNPENILTLNTSEKDSAGVPKMHIKLSYSDYEKRSFIACQSIYQDIGVHLEATRTEISDISTNHSHLMGTLTMGDDSKKSVVDKYGRSHDHPNLFVVGYSLFPTSTPVNPTLTIAALSLRTASEIIKELKI